MCASEWMSAEQENILLPSSMYQLVETEENEGGDDNSVPLGKLTKAQIEKGQDVLKRLEAAIEAGNKKAYDDLSSEFFSLIPTNFGRQRPESIKTIEKLREKEELLKFYLRMGFEELDEEPGLTPIHGVLSLPLPASLTEAARGICTSGDISSSDAKGKQLAATQAGSPVRQMAVALYAAIMLYTSNAIYAQLNKVLLSLFVSSSLPVANHF